MRMTPQLALLTIVVSMTLLLALLTIWRWMYVLPGRCATARGGQLGSAADTAYTIVHRMGQGSDHACMLHVAIYPI